MVNNRTKSEWSALFEEWERSGETQTAFCRRRDIKYINFRNRRYEQMKKARPASASSIMLPVKIKATPTPPLSPAPELFLQLPNGACLRFVTGTSVAYVSSLVAAIVSERGC